MCGHSSSEKPASAVLEIPVVGDFGSVEGRRSISFGRCGSVAQLARITILSPYALYRSRSQAESARGSSCLRRRTPPGVRPSWATSRAWSYMHELRPAAHHGVVDGHRRVDMPALIVAGPCAREVDLAEPDEVRVGRLQHVHDLAALVDDLPKRHDLDAVNHRDGACTRWSASEAPGRVARYSSRCRSHFSRVNFRSMKSSCVSGNR